MAVYVDKAFNTAGLRSSRWRHDQACHMWADTLEELIALGRKIGLQPSWVQRRNRFPEFHFDVTPRKREQAIAAGAEPASLVEHYKKRRELDA